MGFLDKFSKKKSSSPDPPAESTSAATNSEAAQLDVPSSEAQPVTNSAPVIPSDDPFAAQRTAEDDPFAKQKVGEEQPAIGSLSSDTGEGVGIRRTSKEWDASKVLPSQFGKRKGSVYATPSSRDSHHGSTDRDKAYHEKIKEKGWGSKS